MDYRDVNRDGFDDIVLSGVLRFLGDRVIDDEGNVVGHVPPESSACCEEFRWDHSHHAFVEIPACRSGFIRDWR